MVGIIGPIPSPARYPFQFPLPPLNRAAPLLWLNWPDSVVVLPQIDRISQLLEDASAGFACHASSANLNEMVLVAFEA